MSISCFHLPNVAIEVASVENMCPGGLKPGNRFLLPAVIPEGFCPVLYHTTLPYLAALENRVRFNILKKNFIIVQCPHPKIGVAATVKQGTNSNLYIQIHSQKLECPYYHFHLGDTWKISTEKPLFCRRAYDSLFPYFYTLALQKSPDEFFTDVFTMTCPRYPDFVTFRITRVEGYS